MSGHPRRALVLCANPGRLLRYGALFNHLGYYHLSLCLDRQELRASLQSGYRYDYCVHDDFRLNATDKGTLRLLARSGCVRHVVLISDMDCRERRILHEWATRHSIIIREIYDPPLDSSTMSALVGQETTSCAACEAPASKDPTYRSERHR